MPNNFVENPGGNSPRPAKPRSFVEPAPGMDRAKPYNGNELNPADAPAGGRTAVDLPGTNPKVDAGNPIGVGSPGGGRKPFSLR